MGEKGMGEKGMGEKGVRESWLGKLSVQCGSE